MDQRKISLSIVIPAFNEEAGIKTALDQIPLKTLKDLGYETEVIVVDNASTDNTAATARACGATVIFQPIRGYGNAYKKGFAHASGEIIATGDADSTYPLDTLPHLLGHFEKNHLDFLNTNRLTTLRSESMSAWHTFGNWVLTILTNILFWTPFTDSQSGMWIFKRSLWDELDVRHGGMPFSQELKVEAYMKGFVCGETPIDYRPRLGEVKLRGIRDAALNLSHLFVKRLTIRGRVKRKVRRIAFVLDTVWPYNKGGRERRLHEISKRLVRENWEVHVYTMKWWDGPNTIEKRGVQYHAICKLHALYTAEGRRSIYQGIIFGLSTFKLLFERFDVLDVDHMPQFPLFAARIVTWLRGKTLYATWHEVWGHDYWKEYLGKRMSYIGYFIEWLSLKMPDVIIANSDHTTSALREFGFRGDIKTVSLGVDLERVFGAVTSSRESDVIFVGRLLNHKNLDLLIRAIALVKEKRPSIQALIVGEGPERERLCDLIDVLDLHACVRIEPHVARNDEIYGLMKASKMLVLPSVREGFGLVAVEAHAAGIPVITTSHAHNAAKDLITEGVNGLIADADSESIAEKIMEVFATREQMKPQWNIEQYDWQIVIDKIQHVFSPPEDALKRI